MNTRHPLRSIRWSGLLLGVIMLFAQGVATHSQNQARNSFDETFEIGLAALGDNRPDDAIIAFRQTLQRVSRHADSAYNLACAYSLKKDAPRALEWLSRAADWGYEDVDHIFEDSDLTFLRSQAGFLQLIDDIQTRLPTSARRRRLVRNEVDRALELVVMVRSEVGSGAAVIMGREGSRLILATANHVVRRGAVEARTLEVQLKKLAPRWDKALLLPAVGDSELDLAFIAVDNILGQDLNICDLPFHLGGDSSRLKRGDTVFPVGYPNGILWAIPLTPDRVNQVSPAQLSFESQFIRVGFSGGALLNQAGELVGLITADEPPLGRAVPLAVVLQAARVARHPGQLSTPEQRAGSPLHTAIRDRNITAVRGMLDNCVDPNGTDDKGRTALHEAAVQGSADAIPLLLSAGARPRPWSLIREDGPAREWGTPLHLAAQYGHAAAVKALLANGEDVDIQTLRRYDDRVLELWNTPLQMAARFDRAEVAEVLLAAGADIEALVAGDRLTPLQIAAESGSVAVAKVLSQHGAVTAARGKVGERSPLHYAAESGSVEIIQLLARTGLDVNAKSHNDNRPLHEAAEYGQVKAVAALLSLKADVNARGYLENTPLHSAVEHGKSDVVKVLLANGADPNSLNERGVAPLTMAAQEVDVESIRALVNAKADVGYALHTVLESASGCRYRDQPRPCQQRHEAAAQLLIENGADLTLKDSEGRQPLHLATTSGLPDIVTLLLLRRAPLETVDRNDGSSPLHRAAEGGDLEVVRRLIAAKASVNRRDSSGRTALYRAVYERHAPVVDVLLKAGADPNIGNTYSKFDNTPVAKAARGPSDILALLLKAGADPNGGQETSDYSPLHQAASAKSLENVRLLLEAGAKMSADDNGWWPLHEVVRSAIAADDQKKAVPIIELLVAAGARVDVADEKGVTPLHMAAEHGNMLAVKTLLSRNAPVNAVAECGLTPLAYTLRDHEDSAMAVAELLLNARADVNVTNTCQRKTLLEMAEEERYLRMRQLLLASGAKTK